jgi:multiple sugar transport system ATP-binding protein
MVFQSYALYPHLNVADNIGTPLRYRRMTAAQRLPVLGRWMPGTRDILRAIDQEVHAAARLLDIEHLLARRPGQLSGGQRQRVALGRAIVRRPSIFRMDEPLSNLDAKLRTVMRAEIAQLHRRIGTTFLYVTHDQVEAMTMSDRVAVMFDGRFEQIDTPERIYSEPATLAVAGFIGSPRINRIEAQCVSGAIDLGEGRPRIPSRGGAQGIHHVCFRPEAVALAPRAINWKGPITFIEDMGADVHVHVALPGQAEPVIAKTSRRQVANLALGNEVSIGIEPEDVLLFGPNGHRLAADWNGVHGVR